MAEITPNTCLYHLTFTVKTQSVVFERATVTAIALA